MRFQVYLNSYNYVRALFIIIERRSLFFIGVKETMRKLFLLLACIPYSAVAIWVSYNTFTDYPFTIYYLVISLLSIFIFEVNKNQSFYYFFKCFIFTFVVSLFLSMLSLYFLKMEPFSYFKPFTKYGWNIFLCLTGVVLQLIITKIMMKMRRTK